MLNKESTILVVDDQPGNLRVLLSFLKKHSFHIHVANNGERAIKSLQNEKKPDLILLDVMMPGIDGFETCRKIKANPDTSEIPVIFMTALDSIEDKITGFEAGGVDYITKPFQQVEVLARVNTHITLRQQYKELQRQKILLKKMVITDDLTGLHNRRNLTDIIKRECEHAKRHKNDLACLMLDLDHFKRANDTYGHEFGDRVLQNIGIILQKNIRSGDYAFRYGGEEFVVLLPQTDSDGALRAGEKIRKAMANTAIKDKPTGESITVKVSVGVSTLFSHKPAAPCDLITVADKALYAAKANGRNQVVILSESE